MSRVLQPTTQSGSDVVVWALYDCSDIVSLHTTRQAALVMALAEIPQ